MKRLTILLAAAAGLAISAGAALADTTIKMVEVITSPPRTEFLKKQIAEFEQANPGIKVELVSLPWGQAFEKFLTMVQAGDTPDVVEMPERWMGLYANNGQLEDLGPYMAKWDDAKTLGDRAKQFGSTVNNTQFMIPYGYYVNALFWNKKLFKEAGLDRPPENLDEFVEFSKKISAIPGKYGYCLRGGPGAFNGMHMFMNIANGKGGYFTEDGTSTINEEGSVKGLQMLADMYKNGLAPKDSVSWGFNETVTGFYSGTCAMLNQDPDALLGIADKMSADDFAVAPLPVGPSGKSYPTLGYAGWAMFANSQHKDEAWKLMATLLSPKDNLEWAKEVGVVPIHNGADQDAHFKTEQFKG
ncbi:sugar ABC transporter substrate-binding protein, partial [Mesorhizobium sp. M1A.F.Ca.IN.020.06.1.1]